MHAYANPARFLAIARPLTPWLLGLGTALLVVGAWWGYASGVKYWDIIYVEKRFGWPPHWKRFAKKPPVA